MSWWSENKNNVLVYFLFGSTLLIAGPINRFITIYQRDLGLELAAVGIIASAAAIFDMISRFAAGVFSDRKGRKKPLLYLIIGMTLYPFLLIYFTSTTSLLVIQILYSIINAAFWTILVAYLYDTNPKEKVGRVYAHALMANFFVNLISPTIGGFVIEELGFRWLFAFSTYFAIIPLIILFFLKKPQNQRQALTVKGEISDIVSKPKFAKIWLTMLVLSFSSGFVRNFFPIFLKEELSFTYTEVGLFFSGGTLILLIAQPVIGWLADRFKSRVVIPSGIAILTFSCFGIALSASLVSLFAFRSMLPIGIFMSRVKGAAVIAKFTPNEEHALAQALFKSSGGIGTTIITAVAPVLITAMGYAGVFNLLGTLSAVTGVGYLLTYKKKWEEEHDESLWEHIKHHHAFHFSDSRLMENYRHK